MVPVKKILILPDAGSANPFQYQLISFLSQHGYEVQKAASRRFFATIAGFLKYKPHILYFDWIQSFILGKTLLVTLLKCFCFFLEISYLKYTQATPIVHTLHNIQNHARRWIKIEQIVYGWFLRQCSIVRVYSESTKEKIIDIFHLRPDQIRVIQDVPYHFYYPNKATLEESRIFLRLPTDAFVYLFLGMVKPYKGLENLIAAFAEATEKQDYLIIAGASDVKEYSKSISSLIASNKNILFHNHFVAENDIQYYYNAADVVVLPFTNIEHSGSVDLALSFGKPVITRNTPFLRELLPHQVSLLFNNPTDLREVMKQIKLVDLKPIGLANFRVADSSNYREFLAVF